MNRSQAQTSLKKVTGESLKLDPSALITLYEIDVSEIASNITLQKSHVQVGAEPFRFHNLNNLKGLS